MELKQYDSVYQMLHDMPNEAKDTFKTFYFMALSAIILHFITNSKVLANYKDDMTRDELKEFINNLVLELYTYIPPISFLEGESRISLKFLGDIIALIVSKFNIPEDEVTTFVSNTLESTVRDYVKSEYEFTSLFNQDDTTPQKQFFKEIMMFAMGLYMQRLEDNYNDLYEKQDNYTNIKPINNLPS